MKKIIALLFTVLALGLLSARAAAPGDEILGIWSTANNDSQVQIFKVNGKYCAKIISLREPNWPANDPLGTGGKPKDDRLNPDPALRSRPVIGIQFMSDFDYAGNNRWENGKIYDPEGGKNYSSKMKLVSTNRLEVRGFIGFSLFGRTEVWTR